MVNHVVLVVLARQALHRQLRQVEAVVRVLVAGPGITMQAAARESGDVVLESVRSWSPSSPFEPGVPELIDNSSRSVICAARGSAGALAQVLPARATDAPPPQTLFSRSK